MNRKKTQAVIIVVSVLAASIGLVMFFTTPKSAFSVQFVQSFKDVEMFGANATRYDFHLLVPRQTTWTTPFGATHVQTVKSLQPLVSKYNLVTSPPDDGIVSAAFECLYIRTGESTLSLYSRVPLNTDQINSLAIDIRNAVISAPNY